MKIKFTIASFEHNIVEKNGESGTALNLTRVQRIVFIVNKKREYRVKFN